jgi:tetrahydromethanopterin S-methyltransferase subunit G
MDQSINERLDRIERQLDGHLAAVEERISAAYAGISAIEVP